MSIYARGFTIETTPDKTEVKKATIYIEKNDKNQNIIFFGKKRKTEIKMLNIRSCLSNAKNQLAKIEYMYQVEHVVSNGDNISVLYSEEVEYNDSEQINVIPNGFYHAAYSNDFGWFLTEQEEPSGDKYIDLGGNLKEIQNTVDKFYDKRDLYANMNLRHKMGCLVYGDPGNGKSVLIQEIIRQRKDKAVIIFVDSEFPTGLIKNLKHYDNDYIFIFEELTQMMYDQSEIAKVLLFLDGEYSLNKQLTIATTNYPENLPANLASRPGRFDKLIEIQNPDRDTRKLYMDSLMGSEVSEEVLDLTKDMSIAYLKEIILSSLIDEIELEEAIKINKKRIKRVSKAFAPEKKSLGL